MNDTFDWLGSKQRQPMRLGFIGGGVNSAVGYTHYLAARMDGYFSVVAGCFSRNNEVNAHSASQYGVDSSRCYKSVDELLDNEKGRLDAVCILTPTPSHATDAARCLNAGFNVICEKAMATSVDEGALLVDSINQSGRALFVTYNYVGYPMVREARALIASGVLGELQQILCEMPQESFARLSSDPQEWRKRDYGLPCVSLDLGVHVHQMVDYLSFGKCHLNVSARQSCFGRITTVVDTVHVLASYEDGLLGSLMWGKANLGYSNGLKFRVFGSRGSIEWLQTNPDTITLNDQNGVKRIIERGHPELLEASKQRYNRFKAGHPTGFIEAFANIYADFYYLLSRESSASLPDYSAEVALKGLRMLSDIHQTP